MLKYPSWNALICESVRWPERFASKSNDKPESKIKMEYTVVGIHNSGLGLIKHITAKTAKTAKTAQAALQQFDETNEGVALAVFNGHLVNRVQRRLTPTSLTILESS